MGEAYRKRESNTQTAQQILNPSRGDFGFCCASCCCCCCFCCVLVTLFVTQVHNNIFYCYSCCSTPLLLLLLQWRHGPPFCCRIGFKIARVFFSFLFFFVLYFYLQHFLWRLSKRKKCKGKKERREENWSSSSERELRTVENIHKICIMQSKLV